MHVAIVTAGGAGMFCGSCMHDNTWARALRDAGVDVTLIPTYTPIRVDEEDLSSRRVFFGGINVYLEHKSKLWRTLPRWMTRWVDHPSLIRFATRFGVSNDAAELGELTLDMLDGELGSQRRDIDELVSFIANDLKPDVVCFSNALLAGAVRSLRQKFDGRIFCTLQGDDIFLDGLSTEHRLGAIERISNRAADFDGFLVHSDYYRDHMSEMLRLPAEKFVRIPLGIDFAGFSSGVRPREDGNFRIGYFARICPEKGLHVLVEAVRKVRARHPHVRLVAGGYLGTRDVVYFEKLKREAADLGDAFEYIGSPDDQAGKVAFLQSLDVLSVPAPYREPKGIYVLEALACGVPVVQPAHGAYPEMLAATQGGLLFEPGNVDDLAARLSSLVSDPGMRDELIVQGSSLVRQCYSLTAMKNATVSAFEAFRHNATNVISTDS
ncbi:MAG: glycosyltransferase family 4 protein [Planctomycetota bacterium]|nr:glycosyltransferase family 4 protein [Planctomycetota bacterium]MDA0919589.1 glycosyltransferase family 4 protein [Planctomycetota bacterium]MDA1160696.1 glycosyltransferase family 4 protein [Planctomycetota bacterium]